MYKEFFGLQDTPFDLTPNPDFLYLSAQHRDALAGLTYAILARKGFVVLTGNAGTGKTTLLTRMLDYLPGDRVRSSVIVHPTLSPSEFLEAALLDFGLKDIPPSKALRITMFQKFLWKGHKEGKITALVIDEAHKLSMELLEEIRLFGNLESARGKLLQIVLVGQSELEELLNRESLRQFKQRIAMRLAIEPLSGADIEQYIRHRWTKAGGSEPPFTADAVAGIGEASGGIPRVMNVLCDNALTQAFGEGSAKVEVRHVIAGCREMKFAEPVPKIAVVAETLPVFVPMLDDFPMKTLARYEVVAARRSLWARLWSRFRFTEKVETA